MNPAAKEFVPAHILKKRQEEAQKLGELVKQMGEVEINKENEPKKNGVTHEVSQDLKKKVEDNPSDRNNHTTEQPQAKVSSQPIKSQDTQDRSKCDRRVPHHDEQQPSGDSSSDAGHLKDSQACPVGSDEERYLLNAGEDFCEFNGEQFIIPGEDEEYVPPTEVGYDFGNPDDNEDEDVCNAFEEFLEGLPE